MAAKAVKALKEDFLHCSICNNRFKVPKVLPCIHSFCQECLEQYSQIIESKELPCPICRKVWDLRETDVEGLQTNFHLVNLGERMDILEQLHLSPSTTRPCGSCESTDVSAYCHECDSKICLKCQNDHRRFPALRYHSIIPLNEIKHTENRRVVQNGKAPFCKIHPNENMTSYCKTCSKLICEECTIVRHPKADHEIVEASCHLEEVKQVLLELLNKSASVCKSNLQFIKTGKCESESVEGQFNTLIQEIKSTYDMMKAAIELQLKSETEKVITEVTKLKRSKITNIDDKIKRASTWMAKMENNQAVTQKLVDENNEWEVLTMSHDLIAAFHDLISDANGFKWHHSELRQTMVLPLPKVPSVSLGRCSIECDVVLCDEHGNFILIAFERSSSTLHVTRLRRDDAYSWGDGDHIPPFKIHVTIPTGANVTATLVTGENFFFIGLGRWLVKFHFQSMSFSKPLETSKDENVFITSLMWNEYENEKPLYLTHSTDALVKQLNYDRLLSHEDYSRNGRYVNIESIQNSKLSIPEDQPLLKAFIYLSSLVCLFQSSNSKQEGGYIYVLSERNFMLLIDKYDFRSDEVPYSRRQLNIFKGLFEGFGGRKCSDYFTFYILWDKHYSEYSRPCLPTFVITEYRFGSESQGIIHTWNVPQANALPAACYKDVSTNQMAVCDLHGNVTTCIATCINLHQD